ncbi:GntR family transcriptional regulator, partial [Leptospira borgpetersenii serovar Arborea]|nr:GntR family transcriptional regulator [Leptospira borgpetersenii serovar Arborea]
MRKYQDNETGDAVAANPKYRQIAHSLLEQIREGVLKPGDALPTESALQAQFGVSCVTVRQALKQLISEQIVESVQSIRTDLKEERVGDDIYQLTGFQEKLTDRQAETRSEVLLFEVIR